MTIKKITRPIIILLTCALFVPALQASGSTDPGQQSRKPATEDPRAIQLTNRLEEIKKLDKSVMSGSEKKTLRKEVREIRKEMKQMNGGVYLSVGALLIVILILVLIL